jgi:hypothetical protein
MPTDTSTVYLQTKIHYSSATVPNNPGDSPTSVKTKVDHCYNNGYGGEMIWELSMDKILSNNIPELLNATWVANTARGGHNIATITHPAASTSVVQGCITGS